MDAHAIRTLVKENPRTPEGYAPQVKAAVAAYAAARRAAGCTWETVAAETGVSTTSARTWLRERETGGGFEQVLVVAQPAEAEVVEVSPERPLSLTSPSGFTLTGFTLAEAIELMRGLR